MTSAAVRADLNRFLRAARNRSPRVFVIGVVRRDGGSSPLRKPVLRPGSRPRADFFRVQAPLCYELWLTFFATRCSKKRPGGCHAEIPQQRAPQGATGG